MQTEFRSKQWAIAIDTLTKYMPHAEQALLVNVGEDNGIFDWDNVRQIIKNTYLESLKVVNEYSLINPFTVAKKSGMNKKHIYPKTYSSIIEELQQEHKYRNIF